VKRRIRTSLAKAYATIISGFKGGKNTFVTARSILRSLESNPVFSIIFQVLHRLKAVVFCAAGAVFRLGSVVSRKRRLLTVVILGGVFIFNLFALNTIAAQLLSQTRLGSSGSITSIGVSTYSDPSTLNPISNINWGQLDAGDTTSKTIYVKNAGNGYMTLSLDTSNWYPSTAQNYITLNWNYAGIQLEPYQVIPVTLTLQVSPQINGVQSFNFEIVITGTS
jgi:hypothetical protein